MVLSKRQKREAKKASLKSVRFAKDLIQRSPRVKSRPAEVKSIIKIGSLDLDLSVALGSDASPDGLRPVVGILRKFSSTNVSVDEHGLGEAPVLSICQNEHSALDSVSAISNFKLDRSLKGADTVERARRLGGCTRCFSVNHRSFNCKSALRCAVCFKYGHRYKFCLTKSRPRVFWRPKKSISIEKPMVENEESWPNSVSSPIHTTELQNPTEGATSIHGSRSREPVHLHLDTHASPSPPSLIEGDDPEPDMANFVVNPAPYVPEGLEVEDWARPARGRIIISGNPPRRHEEYAIATVLPPPQQHLLYEAMDEVVDYFEEVHHVRVLSSCLSPLGLLLDSVSIPSH